MSHILIVTSNPEEQSMTNQVGKTLAVASEELGAHTHILDLYKIGFDPAYSMQDRGYYLNQSELPSDVANIQEAIVHADTLVLVFPVYWFSMPAMVKGFFDRVICRKFAYTFEEKYGALSDKKIRIIMLVGSSESWYQTSGVGESIEDIIGNRILRSYCGVKDVEFLYVDQVHMGDTSEQALQQGREQLAEIREYAKTLV
ncbi:MAG: NAD(P)H-dependent oxidoreductase [Bifidobacteriaceae bacterium]|nr:NAD(P)H-dependent oxidoreductase [Bifidobacteriaceae bacterium]